MSRAWQKVKGAACAALLVSSLGLAALAVWVAYGREIRDLWLDDQEGFWR